MTAQSRIGRNKGSFFEEEVANDKLLSPTAADKVATVEKEIFVAEASVTAEGDGFWLVVICIIAAFVVAESGGKGDTSAVETEFIAGRLVLLCSLLMVDGGDGGRYIGL
jgi:hypothetical protein